MSKRRSQTMIRWLASGVAWLSITCATMRVTAGILPTELPHIFDSGRGYLAEWGLTNEGLLAMRLSAETTGWVGIGFSQNRLMAQSDMVVGAADPDGSFSFVHDRFATARSEPAIDAEQNIEVLSATHEDGITSVEFLRPLASGDRRDFDLTAGPHFVLYAWGGTIRENGRIGQHSSRNRIVSSQAIDFTMADVIPDFPMSTPLQAGDSDMDLDFDQLDLVKVQIAGKYLSGQSATWGEGDWNGAPGGAAGDPPLGNGFFDQLDVVAALNAGTYLTGPYSAVAPSGVENDGQTSIVYDPSTGQVGVDAPAGTELTSVNIDSAAGVFTSEPAQNLGGSFDNDTDNNIFKATFGGSFGTISFGNVAPTGLDEAFLLSDLTVVGSLAGGGDLGSVDLVYVPEPSAAFLLCFGSLIFAIIRRSGQLFSRPAETGMM